MCRVAAFGVAGPAALLAIDYQSPKAATMLVATALIWSVALRLRPAAIGPTLVGGVVLVAGLVGLVGPVAGRSPTLFALTSVAIGHAATFGWVSRSGARTDRPTGDAVPLAAGLVLGAGMVFWRADSLVISTIALCLPAALVGLSVVIRAPLARTGEVVDRVVARLAHLVWVLLMTLIAIPTIYLPGAVGRLFGAVGRRRVDSVTTTWHPRDVSPEADRREASRMFASTPAPVRRRRLAVVASVSAVGLVAAIVSSDARPEDGSAAMRERPAGGSSDSSNSPNNGASTSTSAPAGDINLWSSRAAFSGVPFADELQDEQERFFDVLVPNDRTQYQMGDFASSMINTADEERRTYRSEGCQCPELDIWFVGGSAGFGVGQRDLYTVASWMARIAETEGFDLRIHNMALHGWVLPQETSWIEQRLASGAAAPDLVVFFDGFNDSFASVVIALGRGEIPDGPFVVSPEERQRFEDTIHQGDGAMARAIDEFGGVDPIATATARRYLTYRDRIRTLLDQRGVASEFFFQPDSFNSDIQSSDLIALKPWLSAVDRRSFNDVLSGAASQLAARGVVDLRDVALERSVPVFFDEVHMVEAGARLVAEEMTRHLRPMFEKLSRDAR